MHPKWEKKTNLQQKWMNDLVSHWTERGDLNQQSHLWFPPLKFQPDYIDLLGSHLYLVLTNFNGTRWQSACVCIFFSSITRSASLSQTRFGSTLPDCAFIQTILHFLHLLIYFFCWPNLSVGCRKTLPKLNITERESWRKSFTGKINTKQQGVCRHLETEKRKQFGMLGIAH